MTETELANDFAWLHVGHRCSSSKTKANIMIMLHSEIWNYVNIATTQFFPFLCLSERLSDQHTKLIFSEEVIQEPQAPSWTCFCRHSWGSKRVRHVPHPSVEKQTKPKLAAVQRSVNMLCWTSRCKAKKHADIECMLGAAQKHDHCCFFAFLFWQQKLQQAVRKGSVLL